MDTKLNKSDWLILFFIFGATIILNCFDYYREGNKLIEYIVDFPTSTLISIAIILIFIQILVPKLLIKQKKFLLFFIIAILILTSLGVLDNIIGRLSAGKSLNQISNVFLFLQKGLYNATDMVGFPLGILLMKKFYEGQNQFLKIEKQQKESELKLLRSQIDPHFLFNNLNTLDSLIDSDSEKAKEYINRLSLIYRYLIQTKDAEVMELSKELKFAENYIFLIETRFGNDYKFNIEKKVTISNKFIPTGALQTLLENVVKHNKANKEPIETNITITEGWLTVKNTKTNTPNKESLGTGLENLQTRYELLSDKKIAVGNSTNKFIISIPIIKLSDEN
ncbi:sensor histidine kinase [Tenacibaculum aiptasiae]|uniref:sensor histidine kinase n=1 Tax=Tenacibaculum aiptasiae TaxID=426481 RepID=UPI00232EB32A|nr:histidine kinase [Tenacibaculum aiptasiae]